MNKLIATIIIFLVLPFIGLSQSPITGWYSLDIPTDARSIAMGESFVASRDAQAGTFYNPANLANMKGIAGSYSYRATPSFLGSNYAKYFDLNGILASQYGNINVFYKRFNIGEWVITENDPTPIGVYENYDHTYGISYAKAINPDLGFGLTIKTYSEVFKQTSGPPLAEVFETISQPILLDLGLLYSVPSLIGDSEKNVVLRFGISLQNFGTDYVAKSPIYLDSDQGKYIRLPRYLRMGFSSSVDFRSEKTDKLNPFSFLITGEYRHLLNAQEPQADLHYFLGLGGEITLFEFVSFRLGSFITPYPSFYGDEHKPTLRYGFGANIPIERLSPKIPLSLLLDYVIIPAKPFGHDEELNAFSLSIKYNKNLFGESENE
jgi:hypothetical protein